MSEDELEIAILEKYIAHYESVGDENRNKCARELDMREVLKEIEGVASEKVERHANLWLNRLAPRSPCKAKGVLRPCSDSNVSNTAHRFHARAFTDVINNQPSPAWDRVRELRNKIDERQRATSDGGATEAEKKDVLILSPNYHGVGIDLKEAWRRTKKLFKKDPT